MAILELKKIHKNFGALSAISDFSLEVNDQEIRGLIGPNGAGKSTLFNVICGVYKPTSGKVLFNKEDITAKSTEQVAAHGVVRTFQDTTLWIERTTLNNVVIGLHLHAKAHIWETFFPTKIGWAHEKADKDKAMELLKYVGIDSYAHTMTHNLPYGIKRCLGVAIALACDPKVLLLDEPVTGMNGEETRNMIALIRRIRDEKKITIIIIEHHMNVVRNICDRVAVLNFGKKIAEGTPGEVLSNKDVVEAYLGVGNNAA
ncbi:MAG: ABC transporter ATP-binding protein [Chloroflexi bacterium]|nr:ABC transporter ATP-binding protein [Chloroflexota bacterium]